MNKKDGWYLIYNVRNYSPNSLDLNNTVSESCFSATNPWVHVGYISNDLFANDDPIFLHESGENNPSNATNMSNPGSDGEHDSDPDSHSHNYIIPNAARGKAIILNLFTITYNTRHTPITTTSNMPTHSNERLREIIIPHDT